MSFQKLQYCPLWKPYPNRMPQPDRRRAAKWSGKANPPLRGAKVTVSVNAIGPATVIGYFIENGYLGLEVQPLIPPDWYVKQNGRAPCYVFGAELDEEAP